MFAKYVLISLLSLSVLGYAASEGLCLEFEQKAVLDVIQLKRMFAASIQAGKETQQKLEEFSDEERNIFIDLFLKIDEELAKNNTVNQDLIKQVGNLDTNLAQSLFTYITKTKETKDKFEELFAMVHQLPLENRSFGILYVLELLEHIGFRFDYKADTGRFEIQGSNK